MEPMKREGWTFRIYSDFDDAKPDQYRYWRSRPASERLAAVAELSSIIYRLKHGGAEPPPLDKTAVRLVPFPGGENDAK
jgi:hypothetical protein